MYKICKNCKKVFWHDVNKCLLCKGRKFVFMYPKKFQVIGKTEVNLPSRTHPETPYYVLALKDENNVISIKKSYKNYKINDLIDNYKIIKKDFIICKRLNYLEKGGVFSLFKTFSLDDKKVLLDIRLDETGLNDKYEIGKMLSPKIFNYILKYFENNKIKFIFLNNKFTDQVEVKYKVKTKTSKSGIQGEESKLVLTSLDNLKNIKDDKATVYFIDAKFSQKNKEIKKYNLIFLTDNLKKFKNFINKNEFSEKNFYGEEAKIIFDYIKNFK